jgi:hypothetical protein
MSAASFPGPGPGEEPDGSAPLPGDDGDGDGGSGRDGDGRDGGGSGRDGGDGRDGDDGGGGWGQDGGEGGGNGQGVFVVLPAEELTLEGFTQDGRADTMAPGPLLETVLEAAAGPDGGGLAGLGDDQLLGFLAGVLRVEARMAWAKLAAMAQLASRPGYKDRAADLIALACNWSWFSTAGQVRYASDVARRLPQCFAALAAGKIDSLHLRIIEDVTSILSDEDAAKADAELAAAAQDRTYGELRSLASRLVLKLDPEAVRKRKERARRETSVRHFREGSGNAGIMGREMPSIEVLASMQHVQDRARALQAAGVAGTWEELKVRATLDLLQERDSRLTLDTLPGDSTGPDDHGPGAGDGSTAAPAGGTGQENAVPDDGTAGPEDDTARSDDGRGPADDGPGDDNPGEPGGSDGSPGDGNPGDGGPGGGHGPGSNGPGGSGAAPAPGPVLAALVNITVPYTLWHTSTGPPGEVAGFGILDHAGTRDAVAAAARSPDSRWCVTLLNPDRTAAAHGCAPGPRRWPPGQGPPAPRTPGQGPPGPGSLLQSLKIKNLDAITRGPCDHTQEEHRYRPSRRLQHLVKARNATCTARGCSRPAICCDLDHTNPHHQGGRTCTCNLAPLCRHHHRCKQDDGWWLEQPEPGVLIWHTPAGRKYTTGPTTYAS